jgi:2,5-furandicarboxylate decarboxylase 1
VDPRYLSAIAAETEKVVLIENVRGYTIPVVSNIFRTRKNIASMLECPESEVGRKFWERIENPVPPKMVSDGPAKEVILTEDEVDLTKFPIPLVSEKDGGPYISSGVGVAKDPEYGRNVGMYRLMYREKNMTGIDLVAPTDLRLFYSRSLEKKKPLEVAIAIGAPPAVMLAGGYDAPTGVDEFSLAGGLMGQPVELVKCETVDLEVPAGSEIVLEGEILPMGWTEDEGVFGDVAGFRGTIKWNPVIRIKAITHRENPIFYMLGMPWENMLLAGPGTEAKAWRALEEAGVRTKAVYATPGGACNWHVIASIEKRPGDGKNALLALLSIGRVKHAIVTDDDVNIFDPVDLERAIAFRVQADRDVIILPGARGYHLDPSVRAWELPAGQFPTTAKMGIDATIPEGIPRSAYERTKPAFIDEIRLEDYLGDS